MCFIICIVLLVILMIGSLPLFPHSRRWGYYPSGAAILLLVLMVLFWWLAWLPIWFNPH